MAFRGRKVIFSVVSNSWASFTSGEGRWCSHCTTFQEYVPFPPLPSAFCILLKAIASFSLFCLNILWITAFLQKGTLFSKQVFLSIFCQAKHRCVTFRSSSFPLEYVPSLCVRPLNRNKSERSPRKLPVKLWLLHQELAALGVRSFPFFFHTQNLALRFQTLVCSSGASLLLTDTAWGYGSAKGLCWLDSGLSKVYNLENNLNFGGRVGEDCGGQVHWNFAECLFFHKILTQSTSQ